MARAYNRPHVLGRLSAYDKDAATWHMLAWTKQARPSSPQTRHYAVAVVDNAGVEMERIEVTAATYTAMRRILHETPTLAYLEHTKTVEYENKAQLLAMKKQARQQLPQAELIRDRLEASILFVQNTPGISLALGDEYIRGATTTLRALEVAQKLQEQIQQVGPPLFQVTFDEVSKSSSRLESALTAAADFEEDVDLPQPQSNRLEEPLEALPKSPSTKFSDDDGIQVPVGMRFPNFPLEKKLKPLNAAYLQLLEGFQLLLRDSAWIKKLYRRFDAMELEKMPADAVKFTKSEAIYLHYLQRYYTEPKSIDDAYLEGLRQFVPVRFLKHELLRHLAEL